LPTKEGQYNTAMPTAGSDQDVDIQARIDAAVAPLRDEIGRLTDTVKAAKSTIRRLLSILHGPAGETMNIVFDVEGQQVIDPTWGHTNPACATNDEADDDSAPAARGRPKPPPLSERCRGLPIVEEDAPLPEALAAEVAEGGLIVERTGHYTEELVTIPSRHFIRRVYEIRTRRPDGQEPHDATAEGTTSSVESPADPAVSASTADVQDAVVMPMPARIVPGGVLACISIHLLVIAKYLDAMPFNRTLTTWKRQGVDIARQTVNDAFAAWALLFKPVADHIIASILEDPVVHADEGWGRRHHKKRCKPINLCTLVGDGQVGYIYSEDTKHRRARDYIPSTFKGYLICDAWPGWRNEIDVQRGGCNIHARRPFAAQLKIVSEDPDAASIVALYAKVYFLEKQVNEGPEDDLLERRRLVRDQQIRPIMDQIRSEADRIAGSHPHGDNLAKGARYIQNHWDDLTRFLDNPLLPPDNNAAENALRINALIRKNSLFHGSEDGGHRAATALTILHSCRLAQIEPLSYLEQVTPQLLALRDRGTLAGTDLGHLTPRAVALAKESEQTSC